MPLAKKPELTEVARGLHERLQDDLGVVVDYDETANIGKRYRRQDEIGTPYCVTVDFDTLQDEAVTIRDRDSMSQQRIGLSEVSGFLREVLR